MLDNRDVGNALFTLDLEGDIDPSLLERCKNKDQDAMRQFVQRYWKQHENKGKWQLKNTPGAERFIHAPIDNWIFQVKAILNSKNPLPDDTRSVKLTEKRRLAR